MNPPSPSALRPKTATRATTSGMICLPTRWRWILPNKRRQSLSTVLILSPRDSSTLGRLVARRAANVLSPIRPFGTKWIEQAHIVGVTHIIILVQSPLVFIGRMSVFIACPDVGDVRLPADDRRQSDRGAGERHAPPTPDDASRTHATRSARPAVRRRKPTAARKNDPISRNHPRRKSVHLRRQEPKER